MNKRLYPISKNCFQEHIYPYLLELKGGRGRPALIGDYDFFFGVLFVMCTGIHGEIYPIVMAAGIQFTLVLNDGANQGGFGNYCRGFKHKS